MLVVSTCTRHAWTLHNNGISVTWESSVNLVNHDSKNLSFCLSNALNHTTMLFLNTTHQHSNNGVEPALYPENVTLISGSTRTSFAVSAIKVGQSVLRVTTNDVMLSLPETPNIQIFVIHSHALYVTNIVIGWIYFAAWSISFYPQVILNFKRKSVVGLNFDFLAYNILGFTAYGLYNIGMFWIPTVQDEYRQLHPNGVNPVELNDVCFTLHATLITLVTIIQCFIYERGGQKLSLVARILLTAAMVAIVILLIVSACGKLTWLTYLMVFSYLKLGISLIKYIPQAYMNYRRKSTEGWSIGNVLLDFTGGSLSILQMILQSYNNDEWDLVFGDPTKFGLGLISVLFDIFFMLQHYVFYRQKPQIDNEPLVGEDSDC